MIIVYYCLKNERETLMPEIKISASILNSDLGNLREMAKKVDESNIEYLHYDVMDGEFVENITYGSGIQAAIKPDSKAIMDTHLMVMHPGRQIKLFAKAGSDIITFHEESDCDISAVIDEIKSYGVKAGLAIKPGTPAERVFPYLDKLDMVLVMTVEPGYGGQGFITSTLEKIAAIREKAPHIDIQVDGGINSETAKLVKKAGANILVSGTYLFRAENMKSAADALRD